MAAEWIPAAAGLSGAIALVVSARLNSRPNDRGVAVTEMQAGLSEQRNMLDRYRREAGEDRERIAALETEVADCERGRDSDRRAFRAELAELRAEVRGES